MAIVVEAAIGVEGAILLEAAIVVEAAIKVEVAIVVEASVVVVVVVEIVIVHEFGIVMRQSLFRSIILSMIKQKTGCKYPVVNSCSDVSKWRVVSGLFIFIGILLVTSVCEW